MILAVFIYFLAVALLCSFFEHTKPGKKLVNKILSEMYLN